MLAFVNEDGDSRYRQSVYFDVAINDNSATMKMRRPFFSVCRKSRGMKAMCIVFPKQR